MTSRLTHKSLIADVTNTTSPETDLEAEMKKMSGVVTLAQEHRFQLVDDQGRKRLFILAHGASAQGRDLVRLAQSHCRVEVSYTDSETLNGYTVHEMVEREQA